MSGHSKWSTIKRKKEKIDNQRGKLFTRLSKDIIAAAKAGGGDPAGNARLKTAIAAAKAANIPNDNIQRAILKATGELAGSNFEEIVYEGYGPSGVAIMLDIVTDNRNRVAGEIRHLFTRNGGNLGETGCVAWMFDKKGLIEVEKESGISEDDLMLLALEAGADDLKDEDEMFEIYTDPSQLDAVKTALEENGVQIADDRLTMLPQNLISLSEDDAEKVLKLIDALEEIDDVQEVYANFDIE
ncbi:MAG: YebC/PmpR family DNA-binding transcriptional regulator [Clostridia bacterium]|nr:YebC/PmpR family DNA-binding transcriptional regulator [Clostridia bacterium]